MTKTEVRILKLVEMLQNHPRLDVAEVGTSLSVSEATVRRLLSRAEQDGKVIRVHGGVQLSPPFGHDYSYRRAAAFRSRQKSFIGNAASGFVHDGDRIFLDSGTTVLKLAEALSVRIQTGSLADIVVLTNSLTHVETLASRCKVILLGGEIRVERQDVCGSLAEQNIHLFHVDRAFFGADAVNLSSGFTTTDERTSRMSELIVARSDHSYVLIDSQKFDRSSFVTFAPVHGVDGIFTDEELPAGVRERYEQAGARIYIGPPDGASNGNGNGKGELR